MGVRYTITLHPLVVAEDIPRLDASWRVIVRDAIREKLCTHPEVFGKPLRQQLKGCRTLRVGDYRVVYWIDRKIIRILAIIHRSAGYTEIEKRL